MDIPDRGDIKKVDSLKISGLYYLKQSKVPYCREKGGSMKKIIIPFHTLIFTALTLCFTLCSAQQQEVQPVQFKEISARLYEVIGGQGARGGVYIGDNAVLVIDAKMDKNSVDQVLEGIKKITDKPIRYLVNTHSDADHIRGNQYFPPDILVIAHENCRKDFFLPDSAGNPSEWNKPELAPFIPSITFPEKMDIYIGSKKAELWYFGVGHTTGDIVVYFPEEKTAFIGDQVMISRPQYIHSYKGGNSFGHVENLTKMLATIDAEKFCSGHDDMIGREDILDHISEMEERQEKVRDCVNKGLTVQDTQKTFPENEARLIDIIFHEITLKQ